MAEKIFCPQCGDSAEINQKYCEKCGANLSEVQALHAQKTNPNPPANSMNNQSNQQNFTPSNQGYGQTRKLFDSSNDSYVLKEKYWDFGSGPIYDNTGRQIGKMKRKLLSIRSKIELYEMDGTLSASINRKLIAIKPTYTLHDEYGNIIGKFEKTILSLIHPKFYLKDPHGNIIMTAQGKFMGFDFKIRAGSSTEDINLIAEIQKADRWRDVFFSGAWDFGDTYGIRIYSKDVDRRLLIGFVIAIDNVLHDK